MRSVSVVILLLLAIAALIHESHGLDEWAYLRATKGYVEAYKSYLDYDTYYIVERPEVDDTVEKFVSAAMWALWRLKYFFHSTHEYPRIQEDRGNISSYIADFLASTDATFKNVCAPFGPKNCGFLPDGLHPERAFTLKELVENVTRQIASLRKAVDSGTYVRADDQFKAIERDCDVIVPKLNTYTHEEHRNPDPLVNLVARGCDTITGNSQATKETAMLREDLAEYAISHDLGGRDDNR